MVGLEPGELLVVWVWLTLGTPKGELCCSCLGDCCLGNWARIWAGDPTKVFGDGSLAEATFTPAEAAPATTSTDSQKGIVEAAAARFTHGNRKTVTTHPSDYCYTHVATVDITTEGVEDTTVVTATVLTLEEGLVLAGKTTVCF